ncbi:MAG: sulfotransferase [Geminicoccaceae bacterium]
MTPAPVFLFSAPRAGSTWLQRLIGSHPDVCTLNEPWFLLPLIYMRRRRGISSEYWQDTCGKAVNELIDRLDGGEEVFDAGVRAFAGTVHRAAAHRGERYFLDKTPRYALIVDDIERIFPDAKLIFLWRNPLSIISSMIEMSGDRWLVPRFDIDLIEGIPRLVDTAERLGERALCVRYEDLLEDRDAVLRRTFDHLGLPFDPTVLNANRSGVAPGLMGDAKSGSMDGLATDRQLGGWHQRLSGPLRRRWARRYLDGLGPRRLAFMGYDAADLDLDLADGRCPPRQWLGDLACRAYSATFHSLHAEYPLKRMAMRWAGRERGRQFGMI